MIKLTDNYKIEESIIYIIESKEQLDNLQLNNDEKEYALKKFESEKDFVFINSFFKFNFIIFVKNEKDINSLKENLRKKSDKIIKILDEEKIETINILDISQNNYELVLAEALALNCYDFTKYFNESDKKKHSLKEIKIISTKDNENKIFNLNALIEGVFHARDIVNEPASYMTAKKLSETIVELGKKYGFKTEVLDKGKIESLKMGGIIAVNRGSAEPPTLTIMEYSPENSINEKPIVLVGKGLVFDTGGINLKPSGSLETMKSDKAGAAAVIGLFCAVAMAKLPLKLIGLIPATDNRPGNNAYVPQDIITMFDGTTVEVLNTDAEGRLILADALAYAKKYSPELVIDIATLTGAAIVAVGEKVSAIMGNAKNEIKTFYNIGLEQWERVIEFPLWDDYKELIKSDVADLKNVGPRWGGAITAAKFLEHFTDYPWIHLDIAGPAYSESRDSYRGIGGTGFGVRLIFNFLLNRI
ncbi:MAG TPA: leucyl aminopeptidase [Bacteroidales bacterium]|nr:leucyl aminopeptidase [Bacteroidales bacterium]HOL97591.1 leucyl aminopeptidase [Bacteroidales bacterium]